ncbi:MAG: YbgC/FadM family acyl-CoA thioesterase [Planctomycetes bacterium]|nr:YbgC/FadM family acyl-CoA thioesterase [Planctomycetota bacterium]MBL7042640.1 YbgC/FadM family acyl-CoA thioesterase [Pirellulaceae bacterium]
MKTKVYYADTDAGGVVYYANYLRWLEMARCDLVEGLGMSVAEYAEQGFIFAVARVEIDYRVSAVLGDIVEIETVVERVRHVRFTLRQRVVRSVDGEELVSARVLLACVNPQGKVIALPEELAAALRERLE